MELITSIRKAIDYMEKHLNQAYHYENKIRSSIKSRSKLGDSIHFSGNSSVYHI